jgi:chromosome partitioning protein
LVTPRASGCAAKIAGKKEAAALTFAQTSNNAITTLHNLPGAFSELLHLTEQKYQVDYMIIDLNPSLSAINQNLFLISNAFIIPTNPAHFQSWPLNR